MSEENGKPAKIKSAHLTHEAFYALVQWVATNGERLMAERPTYKEAARQAAVALGVAQISDDHSLKSAMKLSGIEWTSTAVSAGRTYARVKPEMWNELQAKLRQQDADIAALRVLLHHLYTELSVKPPAGYILPTTMYSEKDRHRISDAGR